MPESGLPGVWCSAGGEAELDLRGLDPPEPMVAILGRITANPDRAAFVVRLSRDPVPLFAELAALGWSWDYLASDEGEVRLRLTRLT